MTYDFVNWAGTATARARERHQPRDEHAVVDAVREARRRGGRVRVVGAGHSWSDCAADTDVLLNLDRMQDVLSIDREAMQVTVQAGIRLKYLVVALDRAGLAMKNLGSVMEQSIAGAVSTGTHGSGLAYGGLATQIAAMRLVTGEGEVLELSREETPELLAAAAVSFGSLGIITQVTLDVEPAYDLLETSFSMPFDAALSLAPGLYTNHPRMKMWWLPHTGAVQVYTYDKTTELRTPRTRLAQRMDELVNSHVFDAVLRAGERFPGIVPALNRVVSAAYFKQSTRIDRYDNLLTLAMPPVHREAEYGIPLADTVDVMREVRNIIRRKGYTVGFINEIRFAQADELWLSGAYGRDSCQFGAYTNDNRHADGFIRDVETLICEVGGRPHWGKEFDLDHTYLRTVYPRFEEFLEMREKLDPDRVFANAFVTRILGLDA